MDSNALATAIAAFALGANLLGIVLLLLFNPRSQRVRWYALFAADICVWLFLQAWIFGRGEIGGLGPWYEASVHLLPGLFLAGAVAVDLDRGPLAGWLVVAVSVATLPISIGSLLSDSSVLVLGWHLLGWGAGMALQARGEGHTAPDTGARRRMRWTLIVGLLVIGPGAVLYGFLSGGGAFFVFAMPLITVLIQFLVFMGVVHLKFYDIEVRAVRTGELAARATEMERLAVVGELAASLAHEVRNPLTGVRSLGQRIAEEELTDERRRKYAGVIVREVGRVEQIVSNLLDVARRDPEVEEPETLAPTPVGPLFEDVVLLVTGRAKKAGVEIATDAGDLSVAAPREPLAQALLNLLLNAVQHAPTGSTVRLEARPAGAAVEILVRDSGPGVPAAERERVFQALYSGSGGTGLGLAVVRRIAYARGWTVTLDDAPDGGAEFRIVVPG